MAPLGLVIAPKRNIVTATVVIATSSMTTPNGTRVATQTLVPNASRRPVRARSHIK